MIIIDVDFNTLRSLRVDTTHRFFYINRTQTIEIYSLFNNVLFRFIHPKTGDENDLLWISTNLKDAIPVMNITKPNEEQWRTAYDQLYAEIIRIRELIEEKK